MKRPSFTLIISAVFIAYMAHSMWTMYGIFYPEQCPVHGSAKCIKAYITKNPTLELYVYTSLKQKPSSTQLKLIWHKKDFNIHEAEELELNVTLPSRTMNNGTLYTHVIVAPEGANPHTSDHAVHSSCLQTKYIVQQSKAFNLIGSEDQNITNEEEPISDLPITHWYKQLTINVMNDDIAFERNNFPLEVAHRTRLSRDNHYLPVLYIDKLSNRLRDLVPVTKDKTEVPLTIKYEPISVGKLRLWSNMEESIKHLHSLGFTDKDTDEVKGIFSDTSLHFLLLTFAIAAFHLLFDFLAFKNDISYWKNRDTMIGLSSRVVVWRCVSTCVIFLYLWNEETSLLVLIPAGFGTVIEMWKVTKAFKITLQWSSLIPSIKFGSSSDKEKETQQFDSIAMKYLSYVLYPLCLIGAIYSLIYTPHKSWYSWCIQSLVNGVYAFGFLFMLPQLFVNYKMKSVAHLPWKAFMYKAFNTFIDDIFAFIITMPTAHRLACFRDDLVFIVYLYQRWFVIVAL